jgi:carbonic anhydrase
MGHTQCGAVTAVVKGAELHGHFLALAQKIRPAAEKARADTVNAEEAVPKAIQANVWQSIEEIIRQSSIVREKLGAGRLSILGALYDLESGKVTWLGPHPAQEALVALAEQAETDAALAKKTRESGPNTAGASRPRRSAAPPTVAQHEEEHPEPAQAPATPTKSR